MSLNAENLLYLTTAFQPTASYKRPSFIDFYIFIGKQKYHISFARDCMGLGWIETDKKFPKEDCTITRFPPITSHYDQTFRNWFPLQLRIERRAGRHNALKSIVQSAINALRDESNIACVSRLAVFKEESGALQYNWEIIDGRIPEIIAEHVGDPGQLLTDEFVQRKILYPPQRVGTQEKIWKEGKNRKNQVRSNIPVEGSTQSG